MSIINKYLTKEIFKFFGIVLAIVTSIYVIVDFFEKIDNFIGRGLALATIIKFFLFKIPFITSQIIPVCILLAVLIAFGLMNRNNEIIALQSGGASVYLIIKPALLIGMFLSVFLFFLSETIVPITINEVNDIWLKRTKKQSNVVSKGKNIWIKSGSSIMRITYYNPADDTIFGITCSAFDDKFTIIKRIDAKRGIFKQGQWFLYDVMEQRLDKNGKYDITFFEEKTEKIGILPEDLQCVVKKSEEMNFKELFRYIKKVESEGYDATIYKVDFYAKLAFPFVCIIMCLIGSGIAIKKKLKQNLHLNVACGIGAAFLYWILYSFCVSLGYGEMLPPFIAAWSANFVFLCIGMIVLWYSY